MQKKKVLVVGFGMMGCRHVQAFLQDKTKYEVHVLELSQENIQTNLVRIGAKLEDCIWYDNLKNVPLLDVAVVATSSAPRFNILKELINKGYRKFLIEKIVFQSGDQFKEILDLVESTNSEVYCNFVNRYFEAYNRIKKDLSQINEGKISMTVHGGEFGLGCNAIHYIDIFQYISDSNKISNISAIVDVLEEPNRRGSIYKEFTGTMQFTNEALDNILLVAEPKYVGGVTINIQKGENTYLLNENSQEFVSVIKGKVRRENFQIIPTSMLSNVIIEDIFNNNCQLTKLKDTEKSHLELFKIFNEKLFAKNSSDTICPIT
ncbi:putative dehydrogenase [Tenacibaculum skagerrakense]|uniref:Putative dehydrogenase n=1 Tax=Tenacibaculum skagerrakense TaxID=186571 RepID=A0A4R2NMR8_9FLAO|nr:Gfo/Idh/MocA family oxidoreductase [Tenacibaculum skagerrakense]TCP22920.1 putative dehydrogenase [Tenacibaculum skagerrakense]